MIGSKNDPRSVARRSPPRLRHRTGRGVLRHLKHPAAPECASRTVFGGPHLRPVFDFPAHFLSLCAHGNARFRLQTPGQRPGGPKAVPSFPTSSCPSAEPPPVPLVDPVADGALFRSPIVGLFAVGMAASALGIARCDKPGTLQKLLRQTSLPARHQYGLQIAEGMVTFFESYERELEKYWTKTLFFQLS